MCVVSNRCALPAFALTPFVGPGPQSFKEFKASFIATQPPEFHARLSGHFDDLMKGINTYVTLLGDLINTIKPSEQARGSTAAPAESS